jgi:hypothetical protein
MTGECTQTQVGKAVDLFGWSFWMSPLVAGTVVVFFWPWRSRVGPAS